MHLHLGWVREVQHLKVCKISRWEKTSDTVCMPMPEDYQWFCHRTCFEIQDAACFLKVPLIFAISLALARGEEMESSSSACICWMLWEECAVCLLKHRVLLSWPYFVCLSLWNGIRCAGGPAAVCKCLLGSGPTWYQPHIISVAEISLTKTDALTNIIVLRCLALFSKYFSLRLPGCDVFGGTAGQLQTIIISTKYHNYRPYLFLIWYFTAGSGSQCKKTGADTLSLVDSAVRASCLRATPRVFALYYRDDVASY